MKNIHAKKQRGFTLIELMVALLLGLLVVAAAGSIFLSNRRVYGSTEAVGRIQENQRAAFEMIARDIREAGVNPCSRFNAANPIAMQMTAPDTVFWLRFANGVFGGTSGGNDSLSLYLANGREYRVQAHARPADPVTLNTTAGLAAGQALMICNSDQAIVFAATGISGSQVQHAAGSNCGAGFTPTPDAALCSATVSGPGYCYRIATTPSAADVTACPRGISRSPAFVVAPYEANWSVGANTRGGSSLYRTVAGTRSEIAEGVTRLAVGYKVGTAANYVNAAAVNAASSWGQVTAIHLTMTVQAVQGAMTDSDTKGVDGGVLTRTMEDYIVLRNHQDDIR